MRRPSIRAFPNTVILKTRSVAPGPSGTTGATYSVGTTLAHASVQLGDADRTTAERGQVGSALRGVVLFRDRPVDASAGARAGSSTQRLGPEANVQDLLTWQVVAGDTSQDRTLIVLGQATPETGAGVLWSVPVEEVR